jgi:AraC family transcriptional regulator
MPDLRHDVDLYLGRCFETEEPPRVAELASLFLVSREKLSREFAAQYGVALSSYLKEQQLTRARELLVDPHLSMTQIGYRCGFGTRRTFYRAFRRGTGSTPDQYRRAARDRDE